MWRRRTVGEKRTRVPVAGAGGTAAGRSQQAGGAAGGGRDLRKIGRSAREVLCSETVKAVIQFSSRVWPVLARPATPGFSGVREWRGATRRAPVLAPPTRVVQRRRRHLQLAAQVGGTTHVPAGCRGGEPGGHDVSSQPNRQPPWQAPGPFRTAPVQRGLPGPPLSHIAPPPPPRPHAAAIRLSLLHPASQAATHSTSSSRRSVMTMWRGPPGLAPAAPSRRRSPSTVASPSAATGSPSTCLRPGGEAGAAHESAAWAIAAGTAQPGATQSSRLAAD